jgi:DNA-binding response OmpR family regulator
VTSGQNEGKRTILVVDDEPQVRAMLERYLAREGYKVELASSGDAMRRIIGRSKVDLVILDLILPDEDGLELAKTLREDKGAELGIIMLSGKGDEIDRVVGLEMGADDYIAKPFSLREILARVKSVLRRIPESVAPAQQPSSSVQFGTWRFDLLRRRLTRDNGEEVSLTPGEFNLLKIFVENQRRVMSREMLLDLTRGFGSDSLDRTIDVQVNRLRHKIEVDPKSPRLVKTVRGGGYVFSPDEG